MKPIDNIKNTLTTILIVAIVCGTIFGIGFIKYKIWRAEHPTAKTWTFFIPDRR